MHLKRFRVIAALACGLLVALNLGGLALLAGCGGGGGGTGDDGGGSGGNATIVGIVLDSRDEDNPVEGATVVIGGKTATTATIGEAEDDPNRDVGEFIIQGAEIGATTAVITAPGREPQTIAFDPPVGAGTNPRLELIINIGQVTGRVLQPDGQPAAGAFVALISTGDLAETDAQGRFRIDFVPLGETQITANVGPRVATRTITVVDGVTDIGDLTLADDPNGNQPPGDPFTISGKVTTTDGVTDGGGGANVILFRDGVQVDQVVAATDGTYRFYMPVGNYTVRAIKSGYQDGEAAVSVTNPNQPATADVQLQPR